MMLGMVFPRPLGRGNIITVPDTPSSCLCQRDVADRCVLVIGHWILVINWEVHPSCKEIRSKLVIRDIHTYLGVVN